MPGGAPCPAGARRDAVSYTHLDVYKRQVYFPYTRGVSSTQVSKALAAVRGQEGKKEEGQ